METTLERSQVLACGQYMIAVLAAVLRGEAAPPLPVQLTWKQVYAAARQHSVEVMVLAGVEPQLQNEPELLEEWRKRRDLDTVQTLTQISEQQRVLAALSAAKLPVLRVKGSAVRSLYPRPEYRQMSDIDLLLRQEDLLPARELLCTMGYQMRPSRHPELLDAEMFLPPFMTVELHGHFLAPYECHTTYYQDADMPSRVLEEAVLPGVFYLRPEDEYLYQLVHFLKHYEASGIGLRQVMDVYVFRNAYHAQMDEAYLAQEVQKLGIGKSRAEIERLAQYCFGTAAERPQPDAALLQMQQDCILSGIYGTEELWRLREIQKEQKKGGRFWKLRYYWQRLFPPLEYIRVRYPRLRTAPWLYPFYWLLRLLDFRPWKSRFRKEMDGVKNAPQKSKD